MLPQVEGKGGLPHGGSAGDDDQVTLLEAGGHAVQIEEAGGNAGDMVLLLVQLLDVADGILEDILHREKSRFELVFRNFEDRLLRVVEELVNIGLLVEALRDDLGRRGDQVPGNRLLLDDAAVEGDVGRCRHVIHQGCQIGPAPRILQLPLLLQRRGEGNQVARLAVVGEVDHGAENLPVGFAVELLRTDDLQGPVNRLVIQQYPTENGHLRFDTLWGDFAHILRHGSGSLMKLKNGAVLSKRVIIYP